MVYKQTIKVASLIETPAQLSYTYYGMCKILMARPHAAVT